MEITIGNKRSREGFGKWGNIGLGLIGALIGGSLFQIFNIDIGNLKDISVSLQDLVAAFVGSFVFLLAIWLIRRQLESQKESPTPS
jgi:uncharacterized membrane protein YeaQ/YmgE (transglycosylase-associated protein family)